MNEQKHFVVLRLTKRNDFSTYFNEVGQPKYFLVAIPNPAGKSMEELENISSLRRTLQLQTLSMVECGYGKGSKEERQLLEGTRKVMNDLEGYNVRTAAKNISEEDAITMVLDMLEDM